MKLAAVAENVLERVLLKLGLVPTPFLDTHTAMLLSRTVAVAGKLGIFDALGRERLTMREVAAQCGTTLAGTRALLDALAGAGYLRYRNGKYYLARGLQKWLVRDSNVSLRDQMLWQFIEWEWLEHLEPFVRTGEPLRMHERLTDDEWGAYQRGMRALSRILAPEVAYRTPVPKGARAMLDLGGSHGYFSVALCRRHPGLSSVVLDLPEAVRHAAPLLAEEKMGDRVVHRAGRVQDEDLGVEQWDLVLMAQLAHHLDAPTNIELTKRVSRALRPGGMFVILDVIRASQPAGKGQDGALYNLYFAMTSETGTWSFNELASWQRQAGLKPRQPTRLLTAPGMGQQAAVKRWERAEDRSR